jgi:hypothetical protein
MESTMSYKQAIALLVLLFDPEDEDSNIRMISNLLTAYTSSHPWRK